MLHPVRHVCCLMQEPEAPSSCTHAWLDLSRVHWHASACVRVPAFEPVVAGTLSTASKPRRTSSALQLRPAWRGTSAAWLQRCSFRQPDMKRLSERATKEHWQTICSRGRRVLPSLCSSCYIAPSVVILDMRQVCLARRRSNACFEHSQDCMPGPAHRHGSPGWPRVLNLAA